MKTRRDFLALSASGILLPTAAALAGPPPDRSRKRTLRIAHITDIHVQPEKGAAEGMAACLEHAQSQKDKPNIFFTGGDLIMDSLNADPDRVKLQWEIFHRVLNGNTKIPVEHCIGNHDIFGWGNRGKYSGESKFGKRWALEELKLKAPYRSFDRAGWHFIVLDSTHPVNGDGYTAKLDDEQFEWLKADLAKTPKGTPIMVMSHIPIIAACAYFDGDCEKTGNWVVPGAWMHIDARRIKDLFRGFPNIKLCISGHEHLLDQVVYNGITYFCNGAASAGWWGGDNYECTYGYALIDLFSDGTFENRYVPYGWKTKA